MKTARLLNISRAPLRRPDPLSFHEKVWLHQTNLHLPENSIDSSHTLQIECSEYVSTSWSRRRHTCEINRDKQDSPGKLSMTDS